MLSRREFIKETATVGLTASAAAAFWNAAPKSVEAYRNYIGERIATGTILPRRPKPTTTSDLFMQPITAMGGLGTAWPEMVKNVFYAATLETTISPGDTVILKQHLGERNRESYLRPHNVKSLVTEVRKAGGNPILCDTMTSYYPSGRYVFMNHYETSMSHGYTAESVGCPVVFASDGYWGDEHVVVPIDGCQLNEVWVAQLIAEGDAMIAFTHAKGHGAGVFGGTLKNLGVGAASAHGKFWEHYCRGQPTKTAYTPPVLTVDPFKCLGKSKCAALKSPWLGGDCTRVCPYKAFEIGDNGMTKWNPTVCSGNRCNPDGLSIGLCSGMMASAGCTAGFQNTVPYGGATAKAWRGNIQIRYTDSAIGAVWLFPDAKRGFINVMKDIQPACDCVQYDGIQIVPDQGIMAGRDIVALDNATLDLIKAAPPTPGGQSDVLKLKAGDEKFQPMYLASPYLQVEAAALLGAGTKDYKINAVKATVRFLWGDMKFYLHDQADKTKGFRMGSEKVWNDPRAMYYFGE